MFGLRSFVTTHRGASGFAAGVAATLLLGAGGMAIAAIPSSSDGSITSCVNKTSGAVRIIDAQAGRHCTTKERRVAWSKGYRYRGAWSAGTAYAVLDVVTTHGSSYVAKRPSTAKAPASHPTLWGLLAAAGAPGTPGTPGEPGPGAVTAMVHGTTAEFIHEDTPVPGMSLTLRAICGAGDGFSAAVYLMDDDPAQGGYTTIGSYSLTTTGSGHANLVYDGSTHPNLAGGLGPISYAQPASSVDVASEFVVMNSSGGGQLSGHVQVTRGSHVALVTLNLYETNAECFAQGDATPAA